MIILIAHISWLLTLSQALPQGLVHGYVISRAVNGPMFRRALSLGFNGLCSDKILYNFIFEFAFCKWSPMKQNSLYQGLRESVCLPCSRFLPISRFSPTYFLAPWCQKTVPPPHPYPVTTEALHHHPPPHHKERWDQMHVPVSSARAATIPTASWSPMGTHQVTLLGQVSCPPLTQVLLEPFEEVSIPWRITCLLWVDQRPMRREGAWSNFLPSSWQLAVAGLCMGAKLQEGVLRHLWEPVVTQHVSITTQLSLSEASHVHALL